MNRNKILNVIAVLFIAVVAGVTSLITANPNNLQLIGSYAKTNAQHAAKVAAQNASNFQSYVDSRIRRAERASGGACDGFSCVVTDYSQTAAGQSGSANVSDCTSYYTGLGVPSDQAQSKCSSEVKPQGFSGNNNASVSTDSKCNNQCTSNETCVSIGSGYFGCQVTSTITTQAGEKRCNGNNLETFNGSSWNSTFCPNGCSGGSCNTGSAPAIGSVTKSCSGGNLITEQDGRIITQVNCQYGCSNGSCNSAPEPAVAAPAATPFVTPVTTNYTNPNLTQNQPSQPGTTGTVPTNTSVIPSQISSADTCTSHGWYWDSTKRICTTTPTTSVSITPSGSVSLKTSVGGICNFNSDCDSGYCGADRCQAPPQPVAQTPTQQGTASTGNNVDFTKLIAFYAINQLGIDTTSITQSLNNLTAVQNQIKSQNPNASALSLAMNPSNLIASIEVAKQTTQQITPLFTPGGINNPVNKTIASVVGNLPVVGFNTMATSAQILIQGEVMAGTNRSLQNNTLLTTGVNFLGLTPVVESSNRTFGYGMTQEQKQQYYSSGNFLNRLGDAVNVGAFAVLTADQLGGAFAPTIREAAGKQIQQAITQPIANNINEALSVLRLGENTGAIPITPSVSGDVEAIAAAKQTAGELTAGSNITAGSTTKSVSTVDDAVATSAQVTDNLTPVQGTQNITPTNPALTPAQRANNILGGLPETTSVEDSSLLSKTYTPQNPAPTSLVGTGTQPLSVSDMLMPGNQTTTAQENIALLGQKSTQPATAAEILGNTQVSQASAELVDASAHNPNLIVSANQTDPFLNISDTNTQNAITEAQSLGNELASAKTAAAPTETVAQAPTVKAPATQTALKPWEATPEQSAAENVVKQKLMNAQTLNAQDQQVLEQNQIRFQALVEASPQDAATMTNGDFQNWLNPKMGAVRNGDLQAASDAFEADRLRGDKFGMSAVANEVADLATVDIAKIEDPVARAAAEAKVSQASQLLGQMDAEIAQANAAIPTNIEGPYVKIPESNNPITTALDVAPGSQSPTFDNLVNSYETGGKSTEAAYNNALSDSEQMRNWLGANTNNGDVIAARNGEFYVKRGAYWEQINSDGTLNNQVKIVESDQGNIALSGGQIVAQGSKVNFAPLSASAKEQLVQNLIDKAPNDGISPEVFFSSLISDGYPPDEITVKLYDDAMAAVNQRYGNTNFLTQARTTLDEAINGSRTLETGAAQAENSAAAAAAPTNELAPAPAAAPETASTQTSKPGILDTLFGKKTIKISPQSTGEITLHPGDIVSWNGHTNTIPDPSVVKTDIYWQVVNGDSLPQKLTPAGITVDISKNPVIEFGSLDPGGRTIDDTVAGITESLGNTRGTPAQIVVSGSIAEPTVVTQQGVLASWQNTKNLIIGGFNDLVGRGTETGGAVNVAEKAQTVEQANPSVVQNVRNYFKGVQSGFDNDVVKPIGDALFGKSANELGVSPTTLNLETQYRNAQLNNIFHAQNLVEPDYINAVSNQTRAEYLSAGLTNSQMDAVDSQLAQRNTVQKAIDNLKWSFSKQTDYAPVSSKVIPQEISANPKINLGTLENKPAIPPDILESVPNTPLDNNLIVMTEAEKQAADAQVAEIINDPAFQRLQAKAQAYNQAAEQGLPALTQAEKDLALQRAEYTGQISDEMIADQRAFGQAARNARANDLPTPQFKYDKLSKVVMSIPNEELSFNFGDVATFANKYNYTGDLASVENFIKVNGGSVTRRELLDFVVDQEIGLGAKVVGPTAEELALAPKITPPDPLTADSLSTQSDNLTGSLSKQIKTAQTAQAAEQTQTSAQPNLFQRVKNFLTNPQPSENTGIGVTIRTGQLPPPEPGIYHPTSANSILANMEVQVDPSGSVFVKTNLTTSTSGEAFVPLRDGGGINGLPISDTVIKSGDNYFLLSGFSDSEKLTLLTGNEKNSGFIQSVFNSATDQAAENAAKKALLSTNEWVNDTQAVRALLDNGYTPENINVNVIDDFQSNYYKAYRAKNPISMAQTVESPTIGKFFGNVGNTIARNPGKVFLGIFAGTQIAVQRDEIYNAYETLVNPGYYSPTLGVRVYYKNGAWYRADTGAKISDGTNFAYQNTTYITNNSGKGGLGGNALFSFLGVYDTINESTYNSSEWKNFDNKIKASTRNSFDIVSITDAISHNLIYNPAVYAAEYTTNSLGQIVPTSPFQNILRSLPQIYFGGYQDHNLADKIQRNLGICFDYALTEQSYLASIGIKSDLAEGHISIPGGGSGGHVFLVLTDTDGNMWIADPTLNTVLKYGDYKERYNLTDFQIVPDIIKFSNPNQTQPFTVDGQSQSQNTNQASVQPPVANTFQNVANFMQENVTSPIADSIQTNQTNITTPDGKPLNNFDVLMQKKVNLGPINKSGDTMTSRGCGPSTTYNILNLTGHNPNINTIVHTFYWSCNNGCATDATAVLKELQDNGFDKAYNYGLQNRITDATNLKNYNGLLVYGGTTSDPSESVAHIAAFDCQNGKCASIDSYFSEGKPVTCDIPDANTIKCGDYSYHVGATTGSPDALYPVKTP